MKVRHQVTDAALRAAMDNKEYRALIWSVLRAYSGQISKDDLEDAVPLILYRTLGSHEDGRGQKFTTSLVRFSRWYASNELGSRRVRQRHFELAVEAYRDACEVVRPDRWVEIQDELNDVLRDVEDGYREVLMDHFVGGLNVKSLARKYGCPEDAARRRLETALHVARQCVRSRYDEVEAAEDHDEEEESEEW